jgi:hypothetical protein
MQRSVGPSRGRVHADSREGPRSDSAAVAVRTARRRRGRSSRTLGSSVPTCLYSAWARRARPEAASPHTNATRLVPRSGEKRQARTSSGLPSRGNSRTSSSPPPVFPNASASVHPHPAPAQTRTPSAGSPVHQIAQPHANHHIMCSRSAASPSTRAGQAPE